MNSPVHSSPGATTITLWLGLLIASSFALAKYAVQNGIPVFAVFYWQICGASAVLIALAIIKKQSLHMPSRHLRYCIIGGLLGVSAPQLMAYTALQHIPNGMFTILLTLTPITTFILSSLYERSLLPMHRLMGIIIGLLGITLATISGLDLDNTATKWIVLALAVPALLAVTNIYRHKALPRDGKPIALATGTLLSQAVILLPLMLISEESYTPFSTTSLADLAVVVLACVTALSYIMTFAVQRLTDGVGFSQVGYFVTLGGVIMGALFFDEPIGFSLVFSVALLFLGIAISNGHVKLTFATPTK